MPDFGVIADVSETLRSVLDDALASLLPPPPPQAVIENLQNPVPTNPPTLTVFLYEVAEDASTRNRPMAREDVPPDTIRRKPPLTLILRYLLTPFAGDRLTEQRMLGRAMQALYEHPIFAGPDLRGGPAPAGLVGSAEALKTTLAPLTLEERTRIWHSIQRPYRLSVSYNVRVANVEPGSFSRARAVRVREIERAERVEP